MNVEVFQCPCGVVSINRVPRLQRPRRRTMLVLAQVSSIKISLRGFRVGWFSRHSARALATSGRFCSAACKVFF